MIQPIKHFAVNWIDGMKISQKHFMKQENHFTDAIRDVSSYSINDLNYGLLPFKDIATRDKIFTIYNTATNDVQLIIKECHAITPSGHRIALNDLKININSLSADNKKDVQDMAGQQFYILISVNPFERLPTGEFDPEETPPRHISTQPKYHVELVPVNTAAKEQAGGNYIVAGRVIIKGGVANADLSFIPPCTSVHSDAVLLRYYNDFAESVAGLQQFASRINKKNDFRDQNSVLANCIKQLCNEMLVQFVNNYFYYRNIIHQLPPAYMVDVFAKLAYSLYNTIEAFNPKDKEETLNYCYEWSDVSPHLLLNQLSAVVEINYDHYKNGEYMQSISLLLKSLYSILEKLSGLEYIGQHKENIIVQEQAVAHVVKEKEAGAY